MAGELFHRGPNLIAQPIVQYNNRPNQVRTVIATFHVTCMTVDAVLSIDSSPARRRSIIDNLANGWPGLAGSVNSRNQTGYGNSENERRNP